MRRRVPRSSLYEAGCKEQTAKANAAFFVPSTTPRPTGTVRILITPVPLLFMIAKIRRFSSLYIIPSKERIVKTAKCQAFALL